MSTLVVKIVDEWKAVYSSANLDGTREMSTNGEVQRERSEDNMFHNLAVGLPIPKR